MNWLGHLWLTPPTPHGWLGALLGDFTRGPVPEHWPVALREAVVLHRQLDTLCARHAAFRSSRLRIGEQHGHYRSVLVDVFWDHVLAAQWPRFAGDHPDSGALDAFVARVHAGLDAVRDEMPPELAQVYPRLRDQAWLLSYRELAGIEVALRRMRRRLRRDHPLEDAVRDLAADVDGFATDFANFRDDARALARATAERTAD